MNQALPRDPRFPASPASPPSISARAATTPHLQQKSATASSGPRRRKRLCSPPRPSPVGADDPEITEAVARIDTMMGRLIRGLEQRGVFDDVSIIMVGDHGMVGTCDKKLIFLDDSGKGRRFRERGRVKGRRFWERERERGRGRGKGEGEKVSTQRATC
ncbi:hypothetical protein VIGAN_04264500 [Vigna angularis var. angularis]|uniref:Sulfatase N-terminal domain-containing protein n=1 Tax=Vigna angularis var. angularis TaxID=157739 RepID=A0A0S3RX18_PHAAN|nr:hypothetical protein VIGAN_04264500 [Vigna angularis var. angularis]